MAKIEMESKIESIGMHPNLGKLYTLGDCKIILSEEPQGLHLSISHADRYPTWDEIHQARYELLPKEKTFAMILPPKKEYVNVHNNCFHLHEIPNE